MFIKDAELSTPPSFWRYDFFSELIGWLAKLELVVLRLLCLYLEEFCILLCLLVMFECGVCWVLAYPVAPRFFETSTGKESEFSSAMIYSYVSLFRSFGIGTPLAVSCPASSSLVYSSLNSITRV